MSLLRTETGGPGRSGHPSSPENGSVPSTLLTMFLKDPGRPTSLTSLTSMGGPTPPLSCPTGPFHYKPDYGLPRLRPTFTAVGSISSPGPVTDTPSRVLYPSGGHTGSRLSSPLVRPLSYTPLRSRLVDPVSVPSSSTNTTLGPLRPLSDLILTGSPEPRGSCHVHYPTPGRREEQFVTGAYSRRAPPPPCTRSSTTSTPFPVPVFRLLSGSRSGREGRDEASGSRGRPPKGRAEPERMWRPRHSVGGRTTQSPPPALPSTRRAVPRPEAPLPSRQRGARGGGARRRSLGKRVGAVLRRRAEERGRRERGWGRARQSADGGSGTDAPRASQGVSRPQLVPSADRGTRRTTWPKKLLVED